MKRSYGWGLWLGLVLWACGNGKDIKDTDEEPEVVQGFEFEVRIDPSDFAPAGLEPVLVAGTGDPTWNPPNTVQLYTPPDSISWSGADEGDAFAFVVETSSFFGGTLCRVVVVVDTIDPSDGRHFVHDDRGTPYAAGVTGAGVWGYGDLEPGTENGVSRRWRMLLTDSESFSIKGRVLADADDCGWAPPTDHVTGMTGEAR